MNHFLLEESSGTSLTLRNQNKIQKSGKTNTYQVHLRWVVFVILFRKPIIITEQSAGNSSYFSLSFITTETASCHFSWQTMQIHLHEIWSSVSWFSRDNYAALHGKLWEGKTLDKQLRRATAFLENKEKRVEFRKVDEASSLSHLTALPTQGYHCKASRSTSLMRMC